MSQVIEIPEGTIPVAEDEERQCKKCGDPVWGKPWGDPYLARIEGELCEACSDADEG